MAQNVVFLVHMAPEEVLEPGHLTDWKIYTQ